ncbi:META domain-containing protein [Chloroflexota bacterium]
MKKKHVALIVLVALMVFLLAACNGAGDTAGDALDGTSWTLMAYRKTRPIPGTTLTATFEDGEVHGSAGCNSYGGPYQVSGDSIAVGVLAITEMGCMEPEGVMEQETMFVEYLRDAQNYRLVDGQLQIVSSDGEALTFVPQE